MVAMNVDDGGDKDIHGIIPALTPFNHHFKGLIGGSVHQLIGRPFDDEDSLGILMKREVTLHCIHTTRPKVVTTWRYVYD